jgi:DmsE family decaheme c-type cytochrome
MACHGDASAHVKDPMKVKPENRLSAKVGAAAQTQVCMTCHAGNRQLTFWEAGKHSLNEVACSNCHSIHGGKTDTAIRPFTTTFRDNEADICASCHQSIRSATLKPSHHPIQEGKIKCSDCHNPHGALSKAMVKQETVNQQCLSCHAEKRGPYVFSHPAVEDNCLSCHNPHGALSKAMVKQETVNQQCLSCHAEKRGPYVFSHPAVEDNCLSCHNPHGSSHNFLLNEKVPNLCQDCHDWSRHPGTFYSGSSGWTIQEGVGGGGQPMTGTPGAFNPGASTRFIARSCLNCHNAIHGSNAPANRGKFLTR